MGLKDALKNAIPTAQDLADTGGFNLRTFRSWLHGKRVPDAPTLERIATLLEGRADLLKRHAKELRRLAKEDQ